MRKLMYVIILASFMLTACGQADVKVEKTEDKKQEQSVEQENLNEEVTGQEATEEIVENVETEEAGEVAAESTTQKPSGSAPANTTQKPSETPSTSTSQQPSASPSTNTTQQPTAKPVESPSSNTTQQPSENMDVQTPSTESTEEENVTTGSLAAKAETNASQYMNYYQEVLRLVNEIRAEAGVQPLTLDTTLCRAASMRAIEMDYDNLMSHTRPDGSQWWTVLDSYGAGYGTCGENVAAGYRNPAHVVTGWKNSPGHYSNMVNASFTKLGVGYSSEGVGDYGHYWCQLFSN